MRATTKRESFSKVENQQVLITSDVPILTLVVPVRLGHRRSHKIQKRAHLLWGFLMVLLFLISLVLIAQTTYCLLVPANYPTAHLNEVENVRSMENPPTLPPAINESTLFTSVQFLDCPITTRQLAEVSLKDLNDVKVGWYFDLRLTGNGTAQWVDTRFLPKTDVNNLQVTVDGQNINYYITDIEGQKCYTIPGFNLTEVNQVKRFEVHFSFVRYAFQYSFAKIPWIFNGNYVEFVNFPVMNVPLEVNSTSDENTFQITFDLPFREVLTNQSGWVDGFVPPRNEWPWVNSTYGYRIYFFECPIVQKREVYGNTYSFTTYFSGKNIANLIQMVIIPSWSIPAFLLLFLAAPFYISILELVRNRLEGQSENGEDSKEITLGKTIKLLLQLYGGPLAFVIYFILGGKISIPLFSYLVDIVVWNYVGLALILLYPIIYYFVIYKFKASAQISASRFAISFPHF